jgi:hypothetical protein
LCACSDDSYVTSHNFAALLQGAECLHELADTLQQQLEQLAQRQQVHSPTSQLTSTSQQQCVETAAISASSGGSSNSANEPVGRLLLRLDHMRSKASYSRTIKQWAAKLNLTGGPAAAAAASLHGLAVGLAVRQASCEHVQLLLVMPTYLIALCATLLCLRACTSPNAHVNFRCAYYSIFQHELPS